MHILSEHLFTDDLLRDDVNYVQKATRGIVKIAYNFPIFFEENYSKKIRLFYSAISSRSIDVARKLLWFNYNFNFY